jgi:tyrosyl-tRNA synthetase
MVNNADWTSQMSVIDFLRDVGKNFSLNTMLDRDKEKFFPTSRRKSMTDI